MSAEAEATGSSGLPSLIRSTLLSAANFTPIPKRLSAGAARMVSTTLCCSSAAAARARPLDP
jgi:hypothetical protein